MKTHTFWSSALAGIALVSGVWADVDPLVIKGSKFFFKSNGTQFFMKGIAYQQEYLGNGTVSTTSTYKDPLANVEACRRDVPLLQELMTNIIRVYAIDPTADHRECMTLLQDAGIYVIADLSEPSRSINRDAPTWNAELYDRYTAVIDELANYNNVVGFFAGNEVTNMPNNTQASAFVKAAVRDMKAHIRQRNYRPMGVGYATNDDEGIRENLSDYFNCGPAEESIDFWGYNIYSWCRDATYDTSGYDERTDFYDDYSVPVFFAEYGCNTPKPREFGDVEALYSEPMSDVWSGGIVYMYFQEANDYGLVTVDGDDVEKLADFTVLSSRLAEVTPTGVNSASYTPTNTQARSCPPTGAGWNASSVLPPTPNRDACSCMMRNLTCVVRPGINEERIGELFDTACGLRPGVCAGVSADGSTGVYGAASMCNATERLSWAFNAYYFSVPAAQRDTACDFDGNARTQRPETPTGDCQAVIERVGAAGTGSLSNPTGTASSSSPSGAAGAVTVPAFNFGLLSLGTYIVGAVLTGAGMILL